MIGINFVFEKPHNYYSPISEPQRFGVPEISGNHVLHIEEKPAAPKSNFAVVGIYIYDADVFEIVRTPQPSTRGELEITDVYNAYIERQKMTCEEIGRVVD